MKVDLKKLKQLTVVAKTGSFSKAAELLHTSQPALSRNIGLIEQQFNAKLFERSASGVSLTTVGAAIVKEAHALLRQAHAFTHNVNLFSQGESGRVAFGMWPVISSLVLPELSAFFMRERPKIHMNATVKAASELLQDLYAGRIEWLLCGTGHFDSQPDLIIEEVGLIHVGLVVRDGHPLINHQNIQPHDLSEFPVLCGVEMSSLPNQMADNGVFISDNFDVLRYTTLHSDGYWITPLELVSEDLKQQRLHKLDVIGSDKPLQIPIALVRLAGFELSPIAQDITEYTKKFFTKN